MLHKYVVYMQILGLHIYPVWDLLLPLASPPDRRDQSLIVSLSKDSSRQCVVSFEAPQAGFEHGTSQSLYSNH